MRGTQLARQWKIIRLLESRKRGLGAKEISNELGEDLRTVYRDLESIQDAGFPIYTVREGKKAYWRLLESHNSGMNIPLTVTELMSLHVSRDILRVFRGHGIAGKHREPFRQSESYTITRNHETCRADVLSSQDRFQSTQGLSGIQRSHRRPERGRFPTQVRRNFLPGRVYGTNHHEKGLPLSGAVHECKAST